MPAVASVSLQQQAPAPGQGLGGTPSQGLVEHHADLGLVLLIEAERMPRGRSDDSLNPEGPESEGERLQPAEIEAALMVAARLASEQVVSHVRLHLDTIERFSRNPTPGLTARLQAIIRESFIHASREVHALGWRRNVSIGVSLDAVLLLPDEAVVAHVGRGEVALIHESLVHRLTGRVRVVEDAPPRVSADLFSMLGDEETPSLLGVFADPPATQVLSVGLEAGDRLVMLGAGTAEVLPPRGLRSVSTLHEARQVADHLLRSGPPTGGRPGLVGVVQFGSAGQASQDRLAILRGINIFRWCTDEELLELAGLAQPKRYRAGELLLRQDTLNTTLFLLVKGSVTVVKDGQDIARTGEGTVFGEMSMLDEPRASATVQAETDIEVLTIQREDFLRALKRDATMAVKVLWSLLLRVSSNLRTTSRRLAALTAASQGGPDGQESA